MDNDLSERDDGGPAFPVGMQTQHNQYACSVGLSVRDWLAGQAVMNATVNGEARDYELNAWFGRHAAGITRAEIIAAQAYDIADAMLARRRLKREWK